MVLCPSVIRSAAPANGGSSSDVSEALPRLKPTGGRRRASRWGISEAPVAPPAAVEIMTEQSSTPAAADDAESSLVVSPISVQSISCNNIY